MNTADFLQGSRNGYGNGGGHGCGGGGGCGGGSNHAQSRPG